MRQRLSTLFQGLCQEPSLDALFLNTVSLLEFTGARKISRTVADRHPSEELLEHLADETRHALAFKRLARLVGGDQPPRGYLCLDEGRRWFEGLDRALEAWIAARLGRPDPALNYLLTTTLIERRAMLLYPLYRAASPHEEVRRELKAVIVEEQAHRVEIERRCLEQLAALNEPGLESLEAMEQALFEPFLAAMEEALAQVRAATGT